MIAGDPALVLLVGAVVVLVAVVASRITHQVGLPSLLVFLGLGLALGEAGVGVRFDNAQLAQALGTSALVLILAEGGMTTNWSHARAAAPAALLLATVGVAVSIAVVAVVSHWLLVVQLAECPAAQRRTGADRCRSRVLCAAQAAVAAAPFWRCSRPSRVSTTLLPCSRSPC